MGINWAEKLKKEFCNSWDRWCKMSCSSSGKMSTPVAFMRRLRVWEKRLEARRLVTSVCSQKAPPCANPSAWASLKVHSSPVPFSRAQTHTLRRIHGHPHTRYTHATHTRASTQRQFANSPPAASSATFLLRRRTRGPVWCDWRRCAVVRTWQKCCTSHAFPRSPLCTSPADNFFFFFFFEGGIFLIQQSRSLWVNKLVNCIWNFRTPQLD